jgi:2-succinyl-6-hydroxy-2,4-cyclohexadiene-1-carboxylate synthase
MAFGMKRRDWKRGTKMDQTVNSICEGQGAPVILIHGLAASIFDWVDLTPELVAAGYAVHALDLLGHGRSLKPEKLREYHIEGVFAHLEAWIDSLHLDQPLILVGHSLGGYLSIEYALRHPEKVRALVLVDPFYTLDQLSPLLRFHYKRPLIDLGLISSAPEWMIRLFIELGALFIRNGYAVPKSKAGRAQTASDYKRSSPGIYHILSTTRDLSAVLPQVTAPALVIWGSHDQSLAPKSFPTLAAAMPHAQAMAIEAGHVPHQSHARVFSRPVLEFLASLSRS